MQTLSSQFTSREDGKPATEDAKTKAVEEAYIKRGDKMPDLSKLSLVEGEAQRFPLRPAYGSKGQAITVWANYFALNPPSKLVITRYSTAITSTTAKGDIHQQKRKKIQLIKLFLPKIPKYAQVKHKIATDFADNLITVGKIPDLNGLQVEVRYQDEDEDEPKPNADTYQITVEEVASYDIDDVLNFLNSANVSPYPNQQDIIGALNIWLRHYARTSDNVYLIKNAKAYSASDRPFVLGQALCALKGYFSSVRFASSRILVNVNVACGAFYSPDRVDKVMREYGLYDKFRLERFLKTVRVELLHIPPKKKDGKLFPRVKAINGFAKKSDGRGLPKPPKVSTFAAGASGTRFHIDLPEAGSAPSGPKTTKGKGKGKGGGGQGPPTDAEGYISVYDWFKSRK